MSVERILLKGGCVLTLDPDIGNYRTGDVLIDGARRLAYELRDYVVSKAGFAMPAI